jgi:hypothetical protein
MRRISSTRCGDTRGVGGGVERDFQGRSKRNPSRCQRSTVSGFTSSSASRHLGSPAPSRVIRPRSCGWKTGLFTFLAATISCWRSKTFSATSSACERSRSAARPPTIEQGRRRSASRTAFAVAVKARRNFQRHVGARDRSVPRPAKRQALVASEIFNDPVPEERGSHDTEVTCHHGLRSDAGEGPCSAKLLNAPKLCTR